MISTCTGTQRSSTADVSHGRFPDYSGQKGFPQFRQWIYTKDDEIDEGDLPAYGLDIRIGKDNGVRPNEHLFWGLAARAWHAWIAGLGRADSDGNRTVWSTCRNRRHRIVVDQIVRVILHDADWRRRKLDDKEYLQKRFCSQSCLLQCRQEAHRDSRKYSRETEGRNDVSFLWSCMRYRLVMLNMCFGAGTVFGGIASVRCLFERLELAFLIICVCTWFFHTNVPGVSVVMCNLWTLSSWYLLEDRTCGRSQRGCTKHVGGNSASFVGEVESGDKVRRSFRTNMQWTPHLSSKRSCFAMKHGEFGQLLQCARGSANVASQTVCKQCDAPKNMPAKDSKRA